MKEAAYKALYPVTRQMLTFHDVRLDVNVALQSYRAEVLEQPIDGPAALRPIHLERCLCCGWRDPVLGPTVVALHPQCQFRPPFSRFRRRAAAPIPARPVPSRAIVSGSGVVVIGPVLPVGQGRVTGVRGAGVVGMFLKMQLSVRQFGSGCSQC